MAADAGTRDTALSDPAQDKTASTAEPDGSDPSDDQAADYDEAVDDVVDDDTDHEADAAEPVKQSKAHVGRTAVIGLVVIVGLATLVGWLGFMAYRSQQAQNQRQIFVEVARQGALNLTTIDWHHGDADVKRILDSATGTFYDDFAKRQQPFVEILKKVQATSKGTITEAGLESESGDEAQVLVSMSVTTSNIGATEQEPRAWRMRISVQKSGDDVKVSNVAFVP
jgi:Mce-associated membrane protein